MAEDDAPVVVTSGPRTGQVLALSDLTQGETWQPYTGSISGLAPEAQAGYAQFAGGPTDRERIGARLPAMPSPPPLPGSPAPAQVPGTREEHGSARPDTDPRTMEYLDQMQQWVNRYSTAIANLLGLPAPQVYVEGVDFGAGGVQDRPWAYTDQNNVLHFRADNSGVRNVPALVIHELTHAFTSAGQWHGAPKWLTEGIADWVSHKLAPNEYGTPEPVAGPDVSRKPQDIQSGYQPAAGFIEWLNTQHENGAQVLAHLLDSGQYSKQKFTEIFGKDPGTLMAEYRKSPALDDPYSFFAQVGKFQEDPPRDKHTTALTPRGYTYTEPPRQLQAVANYPFELLNYFPNMSPYAQSMARSLADYHHAALTAAHNNSRIFESDHYSIGDFVADLRDALERGPQFQDQLEFQARSIRAGGNRGIPV